MISLIILKLDGEVCLVSRHSFDVVCVCVASRCPTSETIIKCKTFKSIVGVEHLETLINALFLVKMGMNNIKHA